MKIKKFENMLRKLEKHMGEKAIYLEYDDHDGEFYPKEWEPKCGIYNVYVAGYHVADTGEMILENDMQKTESSKVLKCGDSYFAFSHRGGQMFSPGDKVFDEKWIITKDHPDYNKYLERAVETMDENQYYDGLDPEDKIMDFIPFTERGKEVIKTDKQCFQAALNFSYYI